MQRITDSTNKFTTNGLNIIGTNEADADFVFGSTSLVDDGDANHDKRFFFDKSKGAFAAGYWTATEIDTIGNYSAGFGSGTAVSGAQSFVCGSAVVVSGDNSFGCGINTDATGGASFVAGRDCLASGAQSYAFGNDSDATASNAGAMGSNALANLRDQLAHGNYTANGSGASQHSWVLPTTTTTDATPTVLKLAGGSPDNVVITASTLWSFKATVIGLQTATAGGGTVGNAGRYTVEGLLYRDGSNNTTLKWSNVNVDFENDAAWDCSVAANDSLESLEITCTGIADATIHWHATIHIVQVK